jgi:phosphoesterase RecJ-like protein
MAPQTALKAIRAHEKFILTTHQGPDGDGLGSMYALHRGLKALGKDCISLISQEIPAKFAFIDKKRVIKKADGVPRGLKDRFLIVLDTNDGMNLGGLSDSVLPQAKGVFFIDHHEAPPDFAYDGWIDSKAAATSEMVLDLLEALAVPIETDMATALFTGIAYDTGSFIYQKTTARSFKAALALVSAGASPTAIHALLHENSNAAALMLMKAAISSLELRLNGRLACMILSKNDFSATGAKYEDAEGFINIPLQVKDVEVSLFIKENPESGVRCSLRSKGGVNVAAIAQHFGGGGHATAAGLKYSGGIDEAKRELVSMTERVLKGGSVPKPEPMRPAGKKARGPSKD